MAASWWFRMLVHASRHCFEDASSCERISACLHHISKEGTEINYEHAWWGENVGIARGQELCTYATTHHRACPRMHAAGLTFSSMDSESLKSFSMASTSASLGVLFRKRPKVRCARCIVQGGRGEGVQQCAGGGGEYGGLAP